MSSVIEQIADNVKTTISGITTGNGYTQTLTAVRPAKLIADVGNNKAYVFLTGVDRVENGAYQHATWHAHFEVLVATMVQGEDTTPVNTYQNETRSDIEKALMVDAHRNGVALDTILMGCEIHDEVNGGFDGITVRFDVHYRTLIADPYSQ